MNYKVLSIVAVTAALLTSCGGGGASKAKLTSEVDSVSYFIGYDYGSSMVRDLGAVPGNTMNFDAIGVGFSDGITALDEQVAVDSRQAFLQAFFMDLQKAAADSVSVAGDDNGNTSVKGNGLSTVIKDRIDSMCYILGYQYGNGFLEGIDNMPGEDPNVTLVNAGFKLGITNDTVNFNYDIDTRAYLMAYFQRVEAEEKEKELAPIREEMQAFLDANKEKEGVMVTESGLQYEVIKEGNGPKPAATDKVKVLYKGTTIDGTVFDSSEDKANPFETPLNRVIRGWTEGIQLMPVGSKYKFTIPAELAYGERGAGPKIGPASVLVFEVELLDIVK